jgi:hypothetical protein
LIGIERQHWPKTHLLKTQVHATWAAEQTNDPDTSGCRGLSDYRFESVFLLDPFIHALRQLDLTQNNIIERLLSPERFLVRVLADGLVRQDHYMTVSPAKDH